LPFLLTALWAPPLAVADGAASGSPQAAEPATAATDKPATTAEAKPAPSVPEHTRVLKDAEKISGLITLYRDGTKLYAELSSDQYNSQYIVLISIARGIGRQPLLGGMTWSFGDDWVWTFRKVDEDVHLIRKNVRFRANDGSPEATAVQFAYTDSVLFSLPIVTKGPGGGDLVDLTRVFMSDLPQISQVLPGFAFAADRSTWDSIKGFKDNVELQVSATYASSGQIEIDSVPDSRGVTVNVHYSVSKIPHSGYVPRAADPRVGYFLTVVKDYSQKSDRDQFTRYINRWDLRKADANEKLSPPKSPIVFWIEKTVPFKYRKAVRDGILEWNTAFEQAGFVNALEVRQQPDDATWDPEDVNYNTFRWITSSAGFAMGPSRVNPYTGQILDADILFDADFLQYWKQEYETFTPASIAALTGGPLDLETYQQALARRLPGRFDYDDTCTLSQGMARQLAFGATALAAAAKPPQRADLEEKLILQALKDVTMHEVGHTLGLRHNFKASAYLALTEMQKPDKSRPAGLAASVMDYTPVNIAPQGTPQGDFYSTTIGPYDRWAIEYGYTVIPGGTEGEIKELKKIAARSGEPALAYATDEDTRGIDPDPLVNRFDLGKDPLEYARSQAKLVQQLMPGLVDRITKEGDDYSQARQAFNVLLAAHSQAMYFASRYVGGLYSSRSHKGDKNAAPPLKPVEPKKQREALDLLEQQVFSDEPYQVPTDLYNYLAPSRWVHWGSMPTVRADYPVHDAILMWQTRILSQLLSPLMLQRIHDTEQKLPPDADAFTTAELIERLTNAVFAETEKIKKRPYTERKPAISSLRRNLQRAYLKQLASIALGNTGAPEDCQTIAYAQLAALETRLSKLLEDDLQLDRYSRAHLEESAARIRKVLDASLVLSTP